MNSIISRGIWLLRLILLPFALVYEGLLLLICWIIIAIHRICECCIFIIADLAERLPDIHWYKYKSVLSRNNQNENE